MEFAEGSESSTWHTIGKRHHQLEQASLPDSLLLARDAAFPRLEVQHSLGSLLGPGIEAEGVVLSPLLPGARKTGQHTCRETVSAKVGMGGCPSLPFLLQAILA